MMLDLLWIKVTEPAWQSIFAGHARGANVIAHISIVSTKLYSELRQFTGLCS